MQDYRINGLTRYHLFQALFRSRVAYPINLMAPISKKVKDWYKGFYYRALKALLRIKENANTEKLLRICLGKSFEEFLLEESSNTYSRMLNK